MDLIQSINQRKSIRSFTSKPVPLATLKEIMTLALRAPSWANSQPWEFAIATGPELAEIRRLYLEKINDPPAPDIPHIAYFPEPYNTRMHAAVDKSHTAKGIQRENKQQRHDFEVQQLTNFGSPCEIYVLIDRSFYLLNGNVNVWPVFDCGAITALVTVLAAGYGLGTIIQARANIYPNIIRNVLKLPESKLLLVGIAIGYPDWTDPGNQYRSDRAPEAELVHWYGF